MWQKMSTHTDVGGGGGGGGGGNPQLCIITVIVLFKTQRCTCEKIFVLLQLQSEHITVQAGHCHIGKVMVITS